MELIRIIADLMAGVAFHPGEGLPIDGPLLYATVLERQGAAFFEREPTPDELARETAEPDPDMPLGVHRAGGTWCYKASLAELHGHHGTEQLHWNKRFDDARALDALGRGQLDMGRRRKVNTQSGPYKSYHQPLYIEHVERLIWHAVGSTERIAYLLSEHVTHLGKKRGTGHGAVLAWTVEPSDASTDRWMWRPDGEPAKALPLTMVDDWRGEVMHAGVRPPYWLPAHQTRCAAPAGADT